MTPLKIDPEQRAVDYLEQLSELTNARFRQADAALQVERHERRLAEITPVDVVLFSAAVQSYDFEHVYICRRALVVEGSGEGRLCARETRRSPSKTWREDQLLYCDEHCPKPEATAAEPLSGPDIPF